MTRAVRRYYHATESRFHLGTDGTVRSPHTTDAYVNQRVLREVFDEVVIVARVDTSRVRDDGEPVTGPGVSVLALPSYRGGAQALRALPRLRRELRQVPVEGSLASGRLPGVVSTMLLRHARRHGIPFLANVVGDPFDVMRAGVAGRVGAFAAPVLRAVMRRQVRVCDAVTYVSTRFLQERYPPGPEAAVLVRPGARLSDADFRRREDYTLPAVPTLLAMGSQEQLYKGHDQIIRIVGRLRRQGVSTRAVLLGDGRYQPRLRALAAEHGVDDLVHFAGAVPHAEINGHLDEADLFLMPSLTEGLPRALVEAMARSLPAIGSDAGGIPELLPSDAIVRRGDELGLERAVLQALGSQQWRSRHGRLNFDRAVELAAMTDEAPWRAFLVSLRDRSGRALAG